MSPDKEAVPFFSFDMINNTAPPIPSASPRDLRNVIFSFSIQKAKTVISKGVHSISNDAWIVEVIVSPFMKSIWLIATPVNPQRINRGRSFRRIPAAVLPNIQTIQNSNRLIPTRSTFNPYGPTTDGDICFTILRLTAKNKLVSKTAICALVFVFRNQYLNEAANINGMFSVLLQGICGLPH